MITELQLKKICELRKKLKINKETYENLLKENFKVNTTLWLSFNDAEKLIKYFESKVKPTDFSLFPYLKKLLKAV